MRAARFRLLFPSGPLEVSGFGPPFIRVPASSKPEPGRFAGRSERNGIRRGQVVRMSGVSEMRAPLSSRGKRIFYRDAKNGSLAFRSSAPLRKLFILFLCCIRTCWSLASLPKVSRS
jgi:hypothetical protein